MAKSFDVTLKDLVEGRPADWLAFLGFPAAGPVDVVNADLAAVSAASDKIIRVQGAEPWLLHLEIYSSPRTDPAEQVQWYNTLIRHRHRLPVRSVVLLLRPSANSPQLTGVYRHRHPEATKPYLEFRYQVIRLWQVPVERLLAGGPATVPLAPLGNVGVSALPGVVRQMAEQLAPLPREQAAHLWAAAYLAAGLRLAPADVNRLYGGIMPTDYISILEDSSVFQAIKQRWKEEVREQIAVELKNQFRTEGVMEGKLQEIRALLLRLGTKRFGPPEPDTIQAVEAITDLARLERMVEAVLDATSWQQLLATV